MNELVFDEEELHSMWYSSKDFQAFKKEVCTAAKELIRFEKEACRQSGKAAYGKVILRIFEACCNAQKDLYEIRPGQLSGALTSSDETQFQKWISVTPSRTGLERLASRRIYQDKSKRRAELIYTVLDIQEYYQNMPFEDRAQLISNAAQEITRPSRLFAAYLACAQPSKKCR
ncbi:hypothetical protein ACA910_011486 [Epithemia clementina (nom. ined.)]